MTEVAYQKSLLTLNLVVSIIRQGKALPKNLGPVTGFGYKGSVLLLANDCALEMVQKPEESMRNSMSAGVPLSEKLGCLCAGRQHSRQSWQSTSWEGAPQKTRPWTLPKICHGERGW